MSRFASHNRQTSLKIACFLIAEIWLSYSIRLSTLETLE